MRRGSTASAVSYHAAPEPTASPRDPFRRAEVASIAVGPGETGQSQGSCTPTGSAPQRATLMREPQKKQVPSRDFSSTALVESIETQEAVGHFVPCPCFTPPGEHDCLPWLPLLPSPAAASPPVAARSYPARNRASSNAQWLEDFTMSKPTRVVSGTLEVAVYSARWLS